MATYQPHIWNDNATPAINAENLNQMEDGIVLGGAAFDAISASDSVGSLVDAINLCLTDPSNYRLSVEVDETTHAISFSAVTD